MLVSRCVSNCKVSAFETSMNLLLPFLLVAVIIETSDAERLIRQTTKIPAGTPETGILSIALDGNPFSNPCKSNDQCNNTLHECVADKKLNSSYWYCNCLCGGAPCNQSGDCCTNICDSGICSANGGKQGAVCSSLNPISCPSNTIQCADNYKCQPWGLFGYCNSNSSSTVDFIDYSKPNL